MALVLHDLDGGVACDAGEDVDGRWGLDRTIADDEQVLAGSLCHKATLIEHDRFVVAVVVGLVAGEDRVDVVADDLGALEVGVDVVAGVAAGGHTDALGESFVAQVGPPLPGRDDEVNGVGSCAKSHCTGAEEDDGADVALLEFVDAQGV